MPRFVIKDEQGERTVDLEGDSIKIGRSQKCQIVVHDQKASREHCEVRKQDGSYLVVDLKSRNGTTVNGAPLVERALVVGDRIEIGRATIQFEPAAAPPAAVPPPPQATAEPASAKPKEPPKDRCYLLFQEGERKGEWHVLDQLSVAIGRGKSNAIHFADEKLSAHHAEIILDVQKNRYYIVDHHSTNGTKVDGSRVPEAQLANGAVIELGNQKILFVDPRQGVGPKPITLPSALIASEADTDAGARGRSLARVAIVLLAFGAAGAGGLFVVKKLVGTTGEGGGSDLAPPQGSLIARNHSFEESGGSGQPVAGWKVIAHADGVVSRGGEAPPHGKHGLLFHAKEPGSADGEMAAEYEETINVERGAVYEVKAWVRTSGCRGLAGIRATWLADGKAVGVTWSPLVTGEEDWRSVKAAFLPPRRAKQLRIACVALGRFGDAAFDEVQLLRHAVEEADRPPVLRLGAWELEADGRGRISLTPSGEAGQGEAVWDVGIELLDEGSRAAQACLLPDKGTPKRDKQGQEARGRLIDLETGQAVPLSADLSVTNDRATLSYMAEVPEEASTTRVTLVASLRGTVDAMTLDGGEKALGEGECAGVTRIDWTGGPTPLVFTFKNPVTLRASERDGVTSLACLAAERAATIHVTLESKALEEVGEVGAILSRAERAHRDGRCAEALNMLEEAVERFPDHEATLSTVRPRLMELSAEAEGELAAVEEAARGAVDLSRARSLLAALSKRWAGTEWETRGRAAVDRAEAEIAGGIEDAAARAEAEKLTASGEKALDEEKWLLAKVFGKNLIEKFPGTAYETKGKELLARSDAGKQAADARDAWIGETLKRARDLAAKGQKDAAKAAYEEILSKHPKHPLAAQAAKELAALK